MAEIVHMPKMSDTMTEGVIAKWHKKVGDSVKSGELMAEIETDKATMDYESFHEGVVLHLGAKEGTAVKVNDILAIIGKKGEDYSSLLTEGKQKATAGGNVEAMVEKQAVVAEKMDTSNIKAEVVPMPKMSDTMTEGVIAAWHKKVGDSVKSGELMAEIETDKATMEYESYHTGTVLYIGAKEKESIPVNSVLAIIGDKDADWKTLLKAHQSSANDGPKEQKPAEIPTSTATAKVEAQPSPASNNGSNNGRTKASPLAKKMAKDLGYDISTISGSGDHGRITKKDVENHKPAQAPARAAGTVALPSIVGKESFEEITLSQMRKTIARRLSESKFSAPHFYLTMEINMDKAVEARKSINEIAPIKISFNDIVIKAVASALRQHPDVNVSWLGDKIRKNHHIHIGVAVAVKDGLMVPVVRFADNKSLAHIATEVKDLAQRAHDKKLQPSDWEGSTFTISNLGMFGIEEFTAIINPPDACILAVGGIKETPVVKNGQVVPGNVMKVTMSCDHRAVDGAVGSAFLKTLKGLLEDPVRILI